jgi:hypothetical protein
MWGGPAGPTFLSLASGMSPLGQIPSPLRGLAARALLAISPVFVPQSLNAFFQDEIDQERRELVALTTDWSSEHWEELSRQLSSPGRVVQLRDVNQALAHVAFDIAVDGVDFRVHAGSGGRPPRQGTPPGSLALAPAALRDKIQDTTNDVARRRAAAKSRTIVQLALADEQEKSRKLAAEAQKTLESDRQEFALIAQRIAAAGRESDRIKQQLAKLARDKLDAEVQFATLDAEGKQAVKQLAMLEQRRQVKIEAATRGDSGAAAEVATLDNECKRVAENIERIEGEVRKLRRNLEAWRQEKTAAEQIHRERAENAFDAARLETFEVQGGLHATLTMLHDSASAEANWRDVVTVITVNSPDPGPIIEQLKALGLWQFGTAGTHAGKRALDQSVRALDRQTSEALSAWQRPALNELGGQDATRFELLSREMARAWAKEQFQRRLVRPVQEGAAGFLAMLGGQQDSAERLLERLETLKSRGAGYHEQIRELQETRTDIARLRARAERIRQTVTDAGSLEVTANAVYAWWEDSIRPLLRSEAERQVKAVRVQGPVVENREVTCRNGGGRLGEAIVEATRFIREVAVDKTSRIGGLWRWMTIDGPVPVIWLYSHHETEKWKCQFFRIWVNRTGPALHFHLQSYVPIGFEGDPGLNKYKFDANNVYTRPGWRRVDVMTASYNRANTYSLNTSEQQTSGVSFGVTAGVNVGVSEAHTEGTSTSESKSTNRSFNETISWFDNYGSNYNSSMQGSSSGSSSGHGKSGGRSFGHGDGKQFSTGDNIADTISHSVGASYSAAKTLNTSLAQTVGHGFGLTEGKTLQVQEYHYGVDYSQKSADLLAQWRESSSDAGEIYNDVVLTFQAMCDEVTKHLEALTTASGDYDGREVSERTEELEQLILMEDAAVFVPPKPAHQPLLSGSS